MGELEFLRKKDEVFEQADKELEVFRQKILTLEREIERQKSEIDEFDFNNRVLQKENDNMKDDLLNGNANLLKLRAEIAT